MQNHYSLYRGRSHVELLDSSFQWVDIISTVIWNTFFSLRILQRIVKNKFYYRNDVITVLEITRLHNEYWPSHVQRSIQNALGCGIHRNQITSNKSTQANRNWLYEIWVIYWIFLQKIITALGQVMGRDFTEAEQDDFFDLIDLHETSHVDFRTWCGICAMCERIFGTRLILDGS